MAAIVESEAQAARLKRSAALAAIGVALTLALIKAAAWWWTGSIAMLASFADSALDLAASTLNALAIHHALRPADREHRFGHGKTEAVAGLGQGVLVGGSAAFLAVESVRRIFSPEPLANEAWGLAVVGVSIAATLALTLYQRMVLRRTGSIAIAADRLHYLTDLASNAAVLVALVLAGWLGLLWADGAVGLAIAALVGASAWSIMRQSFDHLIDRELPDDERARIKALALSVPGVLDVHDMRTRMSGATLFVQFHAVFDSAMSLAEAHELADRAEAAILAAYPGAEILVHQDPSHVVPETRRDRFARA